MVRARLEPELKAHAEEVFQHLGLSVTKAITLFHKQVEIRKGLPFNMAIPTGETIKAFEATDADRDLIVCKDTNVHARLHKAICPGC
jgi:DNA-damage-inducible protein J